MLNLIQHLSGGKPLGVVHAMALGKSPEAAANAIIVGESGRSSLVRTVCNADSIAMEG